MSEGMITIMVVSGFLFSILCASWFCDDMYDKSFKERVNKKIANFFMYVPRLCQSRKIRPCIAELIEALGRDVEYWKLGIISENDTESVIQYSKLN